MSGFLDDSEIDLSCPSCGHKFQETLGRLKNNPNIVCPGCGGSISIDFEGREGLDEIDAAVGRLKKTIDDINRRS